MGSRDRALTMSEKVAFRTECKSELEVLIYHVLCEFGLRVSEFVHLHKEWLDPSTGMIKIPSSQLCECSDCKKKPGYKGYWQPKTKAGGRLFPARAVSEDGWNVLNLYFNSHSSIPVGRKKVYKMVKAIGRRAKLPHPTNPHALRATAAMNLASRPNVTSSVLQQIMGWEDIATSNSYIKMGGIEISKAFPESRELIEAAEATKSLAPPKPDEDLPPPPPPEEPKTVKVVRRILRTRNGHEIQNGNSG